jgi:hypothetical protein
VVNITGGCKDPSRGPHPRAIIGIQEFYLKIFVTGLVDQNPDLLTAGYGADKEIYYPPIRNSKKRMKVVDWNLVMITELVNLPIIALKYARLDCDIDSRLPFKSLLIFPVSSDCKS